MISLRRLVLATLSALLGALALGAQAHAAAPGLNVKDYGDARQALAAGAKQVRFFVRWSDFEPNGPSDFTKNGGQHATEPIPAGLRANVGLVLAQGATPIMVVLGAPPWAASAGRPRNPDEYATFVGELAGWLAQVRAAGQQSPVYEIWNEPDAPEFWGGAPDPDFYTAMLKASYTQVKTNDPGATVLTGPTTGNDYAWIQSLYERGAKGSFDGVAVHTDTACSVVGPDTFYRDPNGRLGQFTFLGYREVRATMLANGDDKPIYMSELGWSTTNGAPNSCARGEQAGKKASGVDEGTQAAYLRKAYECLALDPYVVGGSVFTLRDDTAQPASSEAAHYGLLRGDGSGKPALGVFQGAGGIGPAACGDFDPPSISISKPSEGQQFVDRIDLAASASDSGVGLARISYAFDGGQPIRNFTDALSNGASVGLAPWFGSRELSVGPHRVEVTALDKNGNSATKVVNVVKLPASGFGALPQTLAPAFLLGDRVTCGKLRKGARSCGFAGRLQRPSNSAERIGGQLAVEWQFRNKQGQYRKLAGGLKSAGRPFAFETKLKYRGLWRVRAIYAGVAPYKSARSGFLRFRLTSKGVQMLSPPQPKPRYKLARKVTCSPARTCAVTGTLSRPKGAPDSGGKVAVEWQFRTKKGGYRKGVTRVSSAVPSATFTARLKQRGRWRVRATFQGITPFKRVPSSFSYFTLR